MNDRIDTSHKNYKLNHPLMFAIVMQDEDLCRELLNRILPERKVKDVRFPGEHDPKTLYHEIEKALIAGLDAKSIRLDVLFEDDSSRFDIELQMENTYELPKRSRYYHAVMAVDDLKKGSRYNTLKPCYVIFICPFDLMGCGEPVYRFQMLDQRNHLPLGDEQYTIHQKRIPQITKKEPIPERYAFEEFFSILYQIDGRYVSHMGFVSSFFERLDPHSSACRPVYLLFFDAKRPSYFF